MHIDKIEDSLAVLDGELAVPCNPKAAYAGLNPLLRVHAMSESGSPWIWLDTAQQTDTNPVRSGRKQR